MLEQLEDRRLLALGPQLGGIQPTDGNLLLDGDVRQVAPTDLTFRFDRDQQIDPATLNLATGVVGIQVVRSGNDGSFNDGNEVTITPGFLGVNAAPKQNEVVLRFKETLPDDNYQIRILGKGPNALRSLPQPGRTDRLAFGDLTDDGLDNGVDQVVNFELDLAPQVVAVVPQPVRNVSNGVVQQDRDIIEVYFNNDKLHVVNDDNGNPTRESAENPDFYQLIFTADSVRNTDDIVVKPTRVTYNAGENKATLKFAQNLDELIDPDTGNEIGPGTFRLRIGTDEAAPLPPQQLAPVMQVATDFNTQDQVVVQFTAVQSGEDGISLVFTKHDQGGAGEPIISVANKTISVDLNSSVGDETTARQLIDAMNRHPQARRLVTATLISGPSTANTNIATPDISYSPLRLLGLGSSFDTATDLSDNTDLGPVLVVTGSGNAFADGEFFFITDTSGPTPVTRKFEFDSDSPPALNDSDAIGISFRPTQTQSQLVQAIVSSINGANFGVTARLSGNKIELEGDSRIDLSDGVPGLRKEFQTKFDLGSVLVMTGDGTTFADGQTLSVTENAGGVSHTFELDAGNWITLPAGADLVDGDKLTINDGVNAPVVFEFKDSTLAVPTPLTGDVQIDFDPTMDTADAIRAKVQAAIDSTLVAAPTMAGELMAGRFSLAPMNGGRLHLGHNDQVMVSATTVNGLLVVDQHAGIAGGTVVPYLPTNAFTVNDMALALAIAVNGAGIGVVATAAGNRVQFSGDRSIDLGTVAVGIEQTIQTRFDTGAVLLITGKGSGGPTAFVDGQTFTVVNDRGVAMLFEFDKTGALVNPNAKPVLITNAMDEQAIALAITNAINAHSAAATPDFRVRASQLGDRVYLTNDRSISFDPTVKGMSKTSQGIIISGAISAQPFLLDFPGGNDEPGHRDIPLEAGQGVEQHINVSFGPDVTPGVTTIFYNFKSQYDSTNTGLQNVITERQKDRAREAFQLWSANLGVQFLETESEGLTIVTGVSSTLDPAFPDVLEFDSAGFRVRIDPRFGNSMLVMDASRTWNDEYGGDISNVGANSSWFINAMRGIGAMLGLDKASD
ncbi:MAG: hypothetical protein KDA71_20410, partial [Planctomycetales bacterium]|nr:hypothetical protein [Planctomycetales bacterium]